MSSQLVSSAVLALSIGVFAGWAHSKNPSLVTLASAKLGSMMAAAASSADKPRVGASEIKTQTASDPTSAKTAKSSTQPPAPVPASVVQPIRPTRKAASPTTKKSGAAVVSKRKMQSAAKSDRRLAAVAKR